MRPYIELDQAGQGCLLVAIEFCYGISRLRSSFLGKVGQSKKTQPSHLPAAVYKLQILA